MLWNNCYGLKCTFNLNSGIMNETGDFKIGEMPVSRMASDALPELYKGHEIAVHTLTHSNLAELDDEEVHREILSDKENLEHILNTKVCGMAYPYGVFDERIIAIAKDCGIRYSRTTIDAQDFTMQRELMTFRATCHHKNPKLWELLDEFLRYDGSDPAFFCLWGHSYEFDINDNWELIEDFCRKISGREDIFYGTNSEVLLIEE